MKILWNYLVLNRRQVLVDYLEGQENLHCGYYMDRNPYPTITNKRSEQKENN